MNSCSSGPPSARIPGTNPQRHTRHLVQWASTRIEAGFLLRRLQRGESIGLPHSRPMPSIGAECHELRIVDRDQAWRIVYHIARDAVVILEVFSKKTPATPPTVITACRKRLAAFQTLSKKKDVNAKRQT